MKTVQELLIAICDDLQEYINDTPITEMQIDVTTRLLELLRDFNVSDIYATDPDDTADALDDFDLGEIEETVEKPLDINSRKPFKPVVDGVYINAGTGSMYQCISINEVHQTCTMRNITSGWTCDVHDIGIYNNYSIDWAYSTNGHFDKE